jgi:hypothetical protein
MVIIPLDDRQIDVNIFDGTFCFDQMLFIIISRLKKNVGFCVDVDNVRQVVLGAECRKVHILYEKDCLTSDNESPTQSTQRVTATSDRKFITKPESYHDYSGNNNADMRTRKSLRIMLACVMCASVTCRSRLTAAAACRYVRMVVDVGLQRPRT